MLNQVETLTFTLLIYLLLTLFWYTVVICHPSALSNIKIYIPNVNFRITSTQSNTSNLIPVYEVATGNQYVETTQCTRKDCLKTIPTTHFRKKTQYFYIYKIND